MNNIILFHGGCQGCTQQKIHGTKFCMGCRYFDFPATEHLPNLSNEPPTAGDTERKRLKEKYPSLNQDHICAKKSEDSSAV